MNCQNSTSCTMNCAATRCVGADLLCQGTPSTQCSCVGTGCTLASSYFCGDGIVNNAGYETYEILMITLEFGIDLIFSAFQF